MKKTLATLLTATTTKNNEIHGIANSLTTTRDGTFVTQAAGEKVKDKKVPLLLSHDWNALPIGAVTMGDVDEEGLHYDGVIFDNVDQRDQILEGINNGVLAVSVGFLIQGMEKDGSITDIDLLELSITPVPADSKATVTQDLQIESEEEPEMSEEKAKKQAQENDTDTSVADDQPTLQDVLDAVKDLTDKFDKQFPEKDDSGDDSGSDNSDSDTETQTLDKAEKIMLESVNDVVMKANIREMFDKMKGVL